MTKKNNKDYCFVRNLGRFWGSINKGWAQEVFSLKDVLSSIFVKGFTTDKIFVLFKLRSKNEKK